MKPVTRYQSQLLFRKSYKPNRVIRIRPMAKPTSHFVPCGALVRNRNSNSSRSSKAEHPADNRKTQEHYLPGRPTVAVRKHPRVAEAD